MSIEQKMQSEVCEEVQPHRVPENEVDPIFLNRWSPRAFSPQPVDDETLARAFETAKWAPSSFNEQPWRFVIARSAEDHARFLEFLTPGNQEWAKDAPVLIVVVSRKTFTRNEKANKVYQFDAGCAWGYLALGALQNGLITHGMAGFDSAKAREVLAVPEEFDVMAVIAMGYRGDASQLRPELQQRESISGRRKLSETMMEGAFQS